MDISVAILVGAGRTSDFTMGTHATEVGGPEEEVPVPPLDAASLANFQQVLYMPGGAAPMWTAEDGEVSKLICELLLGVLRERNFLERIRVDESTGLIPKAARDTTTFHRKYWKDFQGICGQPFTTLTQANQYAVLREFLWQIFSTDPSGEAMLPSDGELAKQLSWAGFWLTECEVDSIIEAVMSGYLQQRPGS